MWEWRPFETLPDVDVCIARIDDHQVTLGAEEYATIASAVEARRREFTAGRGLAHAALERICTDKGGIGVGAGGQPVWPEGITGSISHTRSHAAVAVARKNAYRGIGIDIEVAGSMNPQDAAQVLNPGEMDASHDVPDREYALTVFSCKEAAFKAVYPIAGEHFGFRDIDVHIAGSEYFVKRTSQSPSAAPLADGRGLIEVRDGIVATIFCIR